MAIRLRWMLCLCWGTLGAAAGAEAPLSDFVSADAALYVEISNVDRDWQDFEESAFGRRWKASRLYGAIADSPPGRRWKVLDEKLAESTGLTLTRHLRRLCAQQVAVALHLPEQGEPQALLLTRGESSEVMAETLAAWNRVESLTRLIPKTIDGHEYVQRSVGQSTPAMYYGLLNGVFVLSDQEPLVQAAVRRLGSATPRDVVLSSDPAFQSSWPRERGAGTAVAYVAARRWDRAIAALSDNSPASQALLENWYGTQALIGQVRIGPAGVAIELQAEFDPDAVTSSWKEFASLSAAPPTILSNPPADAFLVLGGRIPPGPLVDGLRRLMPDQDRGEFDKAMRLAKSLFLGLDPWRDVGQTLFADWGGYLVERSPTQQRPIRRHPFVAVWSSRLAETSKPSQLVMAIENGLSFGTTLLAVGMNAQGQGPEIALERSAAEGVQQWTLTGRPEGELAIRLTSQELLMTSSVAELNALVNASPSRLSELTDAARDHFPQPGLFVWCDLKTVRESLWGGMLVAERTGAGDDERRLKFLAAAIGDLFDQAFLAGTWSQDRFHWRAGGLPRAAE